jgi:hypothetical protein
MARIAGKLVLLTVLATVLSSLSGCGYTGGSHNPSYFPYLLPFQDIVRTHAKPIGPGYYADYDPHAVRLEVLPREASCPVGGHRVLLATVYDENNEPRRSRRVEWLVEGAGNILEVDESGLLPGRGYKVTNSYAVSYTSYGENRVTRGNSDPNDDFVVRPGQTWCVLTSATEGDTHVTVYAPEIANWDHHKVVVTQHWVDASCQLPQPIVNRAGVTPLLATQVYRSTDRQPLANCRVRYRLLDGPPAVFLPGKATEAEVLSDGKGAAAVTLAQTTSAMGVNHIAVEVLHGPVVIGKGETTAEWQAPMLSLSQQVPASVGVGQEVPCVLRVRNSGPVESKAMTVSSVVPEGMEFVQSDPPAVREGNRLIWTLGSLPGQQSRPIQLVFRSSKPGSVTQHASLHSDEGQKDEKEGITEVTVPQLKITPNNTASAFVGLAVNCPITIQNPGTGTATDVVLQAGFDAGLEHESKANPVQLSIGTLGPREQRPVTLVLTPRRRGLLAVHLTATGAGGLKDQSEFSLNVQEARLELKASGPAVRYVGRPATYDIEVKNGAEVPLNEVVVRAVVPPQLVLTATPTDGQVNVLPTGGSQVSWKISTLAPDEHKGLQLTARGDWLIPHTALQVDATAAPGLLVRSEVPLEVRGLPAFRMEVVDLKDPVPVGGQTTYKITVSNQGTLPGDQIQVVADVPASMAAVNARGPAQAKFEKQRIVFAPVDGLQPGQSLIYLVDVKALQADDVRFRAELHTATLKEPVVIEESTTIYQSEGGKGTLPR